MSELDRTTAAQKLLDEFLARRERGEELELEAFAALHADHAAALRSLHAEHQLAVISRRLELGLPVLDVPALSASRAGRLLAEAEGDAAVAGEVRRELEELCADRPRHARYSVEERIGRGASGSVLRVWDRDLGRNLAMKVLQPDEQKSEPWQRTSSRLLGRFLAEAQTTGRLQHPGVVPVHDVGVDPAGQVFFTMKLVEGSTLEEVFARVGARDREWTLTRAVGLLVRACEALAYAHEKGVIHRDLKPANVMVGAFGELYVMDWGLARALDEREQRDLRVAEVPDAHQEGPRSSPLFTVDGVAIGTPAYMPPEQARGEIEHMSAHSDVYSMGAILYHLLAGHAPYLEPGVLLSPRAVLEHVKAGPPRRLVPETETTPPELVSVCERAMERDSSARHPDMLALAADLRAFVEGRVVPSHESGAWAQARKWVARNRGTFAAAVVAQVAVLVAVLAVVLLNGSLDRLLEETKALGNTRELLEGEKQQLAREVDGLHVEAERRGQDLATMATNASAAGLAAGSPEDALSLLALVPDSARGWELGHLSLSVGQSDRLPVDGERIEALSVAPSGAWYASGCSLVRWNAETRREDARLSLAERITALSVRRDGARLAAVTSGHLVLVDPSQRAVVSEYQDSPVLGVAFSSSGSLLASTHGVDNLDWGLVRVRDPDNGRVRLEVRLAARPSAIAWDPLGRWLAMTGDVRGSVKLLDPTSGEVRGEWLAGSPRTAGRWPVSALAFSPDGQWLATADDDRRLVLWQLGQDTAVMDEPPSVLVEAGSYRTTRIVPSSSGNGFFVLAATGRLRYWDWTGRALGTRFLGSDITSIDLLDAELVLSAHADGTLGLSDWSDEPGVRLLRGHFYPSACIAFSPDGTRLVSGGDDNTVRLWDARVGMNLETWRGHANRIDAVAWSADGARIASAAPDLTIMLWDANTGTIVQRYAGHEKDIKALAFVEDELLSASADGTLRAWSESASEGRTLVTGTVPLTALAASPGLVLVGTQDGTVRCLTAEGEQLLDEFHTESISALAIDPTGARFASSSASEIWLWTRAGAFERKLESTLLGWQGLAWSPDGSRLVGVGESGVSVWSSGSGKLLFSSPGQVQLAVAFSPDGGRFATAGLDNHVRTWESAADPESVWDRAQERLREGRLQARVLASGAELGMAKDVVAALERAEDLGPYERATAIRMTKARGDVCEDIALSCWHVLTDGQRTPEEMAEALRRVEWVKSVSLPNTAYDLVHAAGLFRAGRLAESRALLRSVGLQERRLPGGLLAVLALRTLIGDVADDPDRELEALLTELESAEPHSDSPASRLLREIEER